MKTLIQDIVALTREGWWLYDAHPAPSVYEQLQCPHAGKGGRNQPHWFVRDDVYLCIGCSRRCGLKRPAGFPLPLPIKYRTVPVEAPYTLTPAEMLAKHDLLNVKQAAYCLNVSERTIYDYIAVGKLVRLKENPARVRAREVLELRNNFDE